MLFKLPSLLFLASVVQYVVAAPAPFITRAAGDGRSLVYVQNFKSPDGSRITLLPLVKQDSQVTHIIIGALHIEKDPKDFSLNDDKVDSNKFNWLWDEVQTLQKNGVKVLMMLGGAETRTYRNLQDDFDNLYGPVHDLLKKRGIDGLDLDIEETVDISTPRKLLNRLNDDFGDDFILTMAPVASSLIQGQTGLGGFSYFDLDEQATGKKGKLINWFNTQFYNGWGDASTPGTYNDIVNSGWSPARVVMGVLDNSVDGNPGFVHLKTLGDVISKLKAKYNNFGGVVGWEYYNAGRSDGLDASWKWVRKISSFLFS